MTWSYDSRTGAFSHGTGIITTGYSGAGIGRNNPGMEAVRNVGPIPRGRYIIGPPVNHPHLGPVALPLMPHGHDAKKRTEFFIHGDNRTHDASQGCIILDRNARLQVANGKDKALMVFVSEPKPAVVQASKKPDPVAPPPRKWVYVQTTGALSGPGPAATGYSGAGSGRNNHDMEAVVNVGPIPVGLYAIGQPQNSPHLGPVVMALTPIGHKAHNRTGFMIHGDNRTHTASHGCIILGRATRQAIVSSDVHLIEVVRAAP
jgi:hypothetical protein